MTPLKIARVTTVPEAFVHLKSTFEFLLSKGEKLTLISSAGSYADVIQNEVGLKVTPIEIKRDISPFSDLKSLVSLIIFFKKNKFDIIHSSTPKAGLLVALAGLFSPGSIRLHTFTGQRWASMSGLMKLIFKLIDKLIIRLNNQCYADSLSQISFLISQDVAKPNELRCLHKGSYGGINCKKFNNDLFVNARDDLLKELNLADDVTILLFVGQICHDKGVNELVLATREAQKINNKIVLVLIGTYREGVDELNAATLHEINKGIGIYSLGYKIQTEKYFSAADIFCLPSHREGFGTVILEAAACGLPSIGTRIPGLVDSIIDGETGVLVELNNISELSSAILNLTHDERLRKNLGLSAKKRAQKDFNSELIAEKQWQEYRQIIKMRS